MTQAEKLDLLKEQVREANRILGDLEKLDAMIDFIDAYGGDEGHTMQLQLRGYFFPDDCLTNPSIGFKKITYEDKSFSLATFMQDKLLNILTEYRELLVCKLERVANGQATNHEE